MSYWNLFTLSTREWIVVFYAVIIVFIIISMAALIICIVRSCCYVTFTDEEVVERDVVINMPQQMPSTGQPSHVESSDVHRIDENCPIHGRKKYCNKIEVQKYNSLVDGEHMATIN
uniref:Uncharacterized protein n=1 Tax=Onchocerca volvulus TaxID=6282 RepID=A0A8R1TXI4_ONCVO